MRNMLSCITTSAFVTLVMIGATACAATTPVEHPGSHHAATTSLWKVTSAHRTLYLVGETLTLTRSDYPLPTPMTRAFGESSEIITEGMATQPKDPKSLRELQEKLAPLIRKLGVLPPDKTLSSLLDSKQLATVKRAFASSGSPFSQAEHMRPWLAFLALRKASFAKLGIDSSQQLGAYYATKAQEQHMRITPLERPADQIRMFASMPDKLMAEWLAINAVELPKLPARRAVVNKAWRAGNVTKLTRLNQRFTGHPKLYNLLVSNRNRKWMAVLVNRLESSGKPVFVVVGLGHLIGKANLTELLRGRGYTVTQL